MYDNFSNFCRVMLAGENVQLFKLNKKKKIPLLSIEESRTSFPSSSVSFPTAAAVTIDILIKTSRIWFGPDE